MSTIPAKQIIKLLAAFVRVNNFSASSSSGNVTTAITTALSTAGDGGVSVPLQVAAAGTLGVITAASGNRVEVYNATSKDKILAANGEEVYARLTEASGIYTLNYFTLPDTGTEAAHIFPATTPIDFEFSYRFDFNRFPSDGVVSVQTRNISNDPSQGGGRVFRERLTPTAQNAIPNLSRSPIDSAGVALFVNGVSYDTFGGGTASFSVNTSTRAITWSAANSGFNIETTDRIVAQYSTME